MNITYIKTQEELQKACKVWEKAPEIGVDLECENNLHYYGTFISIIQVSTTKHHWIIDVLELKNIDPFINIINNPLIQKIFHDISFDFRILNFQFKTTPKNIFDTQLAALLIGITDIGLGSLLEKFFGIKKQQKFQMANWIKRPIPKDMLEYAAHDTIHLIHLRNILIKELKKKNRWTWAEEEFSLIDKKEFVHKDPEFLDMRGLRALTPTEIAIFKRLVNLREKMAVKANRPVHFIVSTARLKELTRNPPNSLADWKNLRGVHPIVKSRAYQFLTEVEKGMKEKIILPEKPRKRYTHKQRLHLKKLSEIRDKVAEDLHIQRHLIMNKNQMQKIVLTNSAEVLHKWQFKLFTKSGYNAKDYL